MEHANPLLAEWTLPFGLPPFSEIKPKHFPEAFRAAMAVQTAEYNAIADNADPPTFENTIVALERTGRLWSKVAGVFYNLLGSCTNELLEALALEFAPEFAKHHSELRLNPQLFERIDVLQGQADRLDITSEQRRLLARYHLNYVRSGAKLDPAGKQRFSEIEQRLATLHTVFGQNVLHDEDSWHLPLSQDDTAGLPSFLLDAAASTARALKIDAPYAITLSRSSVEPFLTFSSRRDLRQQAYEAFTTRGEHPGPHDNRSLISEILSLRRELGRLMGYETYADFSIDDTMARTVEAADAQLKPIWAGARHKAEAERALLEQAQRDEGANTTLEAWDWRYYAEKVRKAAFDLDEAEIKPYFVLENVAQAAFDTASRLFGLSFKPRPDLPSYHSDVHVFEVTEGDGQPVGLFMQDNFARPGKRSGAWASGLEGYQAFDGKVVRPIILNNNNFVKSDPTLLSFDDARTLFHEFGHALHALLNRSRYPTLSSVRGDYVEFPSQVYEHWIAAPETLRHYAVHHETGQAIPEALLQRLTTAATWNEGFHTAEAASAALLDLELHTHPEPESLDIAAYEQEFLARIGMPREIALRHRPAHFQHLFTGGYEAGYYYYLWSAVLDADAFAAFREAGDIFDPALAARLKDMYELGDTKDPMDLFIGFRGREPDPAALLRQRGFETT